MLRKSVYLASAALVLSAAGLSVQPALAQQAADDVIEEIITTGSRSAKPRSASDSPDPGDDTVLYGDARDR